MWYIYVTLFFFFFGKYSLALELFCLQSGLIVTEVVAFDSDSMHTACCGRDGEEEVGDQEKVRGLLPE